MVCPCFVKNGLIGGFVSSVDASFDGLLDFLDLGDFGDFFSVFTVNGDLTSVFGVSFDFSVDFVVLAGFFFNVGVFFGDGLFVGDAFSSLIDAFSSFTDGFSSLIDSRLTDFSRFFGGDLLKFKKKGVRKGALNELAEMRWNYIESRSK